MITNIDDETLDFLAKKQLSFNQFCICLLVYHKNAKGILKYTHRVGFLANGTLLNSKKQRVNELEDLIDRGYLKRYRDNLPENEKYQLDNFVVTELFSAGFLDDLDGKANEFFKTYPNHLLINNQEVPAKVVDVEQFLKDYVKLLKKDVGVHLLIMQDISKLRYAKMKIDNYLKSRNWENNTSQNVQTAGPRFL